MRRTPRLIAAAVLIAFTGVLGGCSSGGFDPSDLMDFLDTKKKLPGERKPVFPEGVPGLEQGVPKEMYKGAQQQQDAPAVAALPAEPPPAEPAKSSKSARGKKTRQPAPTAAAPAQAPAGEVDGEAQPEAAPAAPPPKHKIVRKRTTAPPPDQQSTQQPAQPAQQTTQQQQTQGAFPAPMPSGSFSR
ncbi:hypothetical protein ACFPFP_04945 [Bradyrhizobium sp. GCM10023182]|uniref:Uncharacterized protein n=1 Tax=Bradyrhizobium zhengyangense TaxID=2911009 RepID=A0ABS9LH02_9BRAD|nr:hypothetical protein [Bradyrhizobium zhengyangense]MCG2666275.1 hypothetical protein [Bradyrhizobium zhengyangense]